MVVGSGPQKLALAESLGAEALIDRSKDENWPRTVQSLTSRRGADVVVHASGSPAGLQLALELAAFESTILEMSWYGDQKVIVPLGEAFHARRLTIKSSQVGTVASPQRARWDARRRMQLALSLLAEPALDVLITGESPFDDLPRVMAQLAQAPADAICHRIKY